METKDETVDPVDGEVVSSLARASLLAALMGATAGVVIPISAVPGTLQMLVVFLAGLFLGPVWGAISMVLYLAAGAVGAPVFAGWSAGLGSLVGPHGGFLWAFPVGAFVVGAIVHRGRTVRDPATVSRLVIVAALLVATVVVYVGGFAWYAWVTETSVVEAFTIVALPLLPGDVLKMLAALAIVESGRIDPTRG
ncbi:biotin transporter BioY [Halobacteria archaeon AArc-dxtr1]|nr:biotin transporter BioY [Halobacteria archaeon AArc-dxtr1]